MGRSFLPSIPALTGKDNGIVYHDTTKLNQMGNTRNICEVFFLPFLCEYLPSNYVTCV